MCVEIEYQGRSTVATVIDECPGCTTASGHLDLSLSTAAALGMPIGTSTGNDNPTSGVTWHAVDCPVSGSIVATFNSFSSEIYFQNVAFPVKSAATVANGSNPARTATQQGGFWNFNANVAGQPVTLTDSVGHTIQGTIPTSSSGGEIGAQFALTCQ